MDGLRALSVFAVILFHAGATGVRGGFLGVEAFFVISGYLITSLLLAERTRHEGVVTAAFWLGRARRLLPALLAMLCVSVVLSKTVASDALSQTVSDLPSALAFAANLWQIATRDSYFMAVDRPPLLQHLWSLGIEEQFYLFWPLVLSLVATRRRLLWFASLGAIASAAWLWHVYDPFVDPTRAYVGTDTRLSGILLGAALAAAIPTFELRARTSRTSPWLLGTLGLSGIAGLLAAFHFLAETNTLVFHGGFLLVDLATMAVIVASGNPASISGRLLGARPLVELGKRSYGLYLWHWPVFAVTRAGIDLDVAPATLVAVRAGATVVLSELCYRFLETPVRRGALDGVVRRGWSFVRKLPLAVRLAPVLAAIALLVFSAPRLLTTSPASARATTPLAANEPGAPRGSGHSSSLTNVVAGATTGTANLSPEKAGAGSGVGRGIPIDPSWPKTLTLLTDSVTLGVRHSLPAALPGWRVEVVGRPALMVKQVVPEFLQGRGVGSVVVIGVAYNSIFEKNRKDFERWSGMWDRHAEKLLADLKLRGGKKFVWVTLREPSLEVVTDKGKHQYEKYAWFFPYVNERIRALGERHPELAIADWEAVSDIPDVTYDLIHLANPGVKLMTQTIVDAVLGPAPVAAPAPAVTKN